MRSPHFMNDNTPRSHWRASLRLTGILLILWFALGYLAPILCRDWLDANFPAVGTAPFGFWVAQQGSIIGFVIILLVYAYCMNRTDKKFGYHNED
jgi:putative solute:sodium symporter small subunit